MGPSPARVWWLAARPATLAVSVSSVLAGTAVAVHDGRVRTLPGLATLLVALAIQVGCNYANDYSDFQRGADTPSRVGPLRAAASGVVRPEHVRLAALVAFALAGVVGLAVSAATDWRLVAAGALAVAAAWLYTGGPRPYGYEGLGEVFVFVFFGLMATVGTVYVNELRTTPAAWAAGTATGLAACAVLSLNNLRDVETDRVAGKLTLAVRLGRSRTRWLIGGFLAGAQAAPVVAVIAGWVPPSALLTLLTLPLAVGVLRASGEREPRLLIGALKRAGRLTVWWALLWALGLLIG